MKDIADIREMPLFLQAIENLGRDDLVRVKQALDTTIMEMGVERNVKEMEGAEVTEGFKFALQKTKAKAAHVNREITKRCNEIPKKEQAWLIYRGRWIVSMTSPTDWMVEDVKSDSDAPFCEGVRISPDQFHQLKESGIEHQEPNT